MDVEEIEVPVPWGHVAAKTWGSKQNQIVLLFHGLMDNLGSFERLMPYLPTEFYYICFDLPSHGKSSPYPPHLLITALDNVYTIKLLVEYFSRDKYILLGHSWGAQACVLFTQLYPEHVLKLIQLDVVYLFPMYVKNFKYVMRSHLEGLQKVSQRVADGKLVAYTFEEAIDKMVEARFWGGLTWDAALPIVKRSIVPITEGTDKGKFYFGVDPRLKHVTNLLCDMEFVRKIFDKYPVDCPTLLVAASDTSVQYKLFRSIVEVAKTKNANYVVKEVPGGHDVHNSNPEIVGPLVSEFLLNEKSKL